MVVIKLLLCYLCVVNTSFSIIHISGMIYFTSHSSIFIYLYQQELQYYMPGMIDKNNELYEHCMSLSRPFYSNHTKDISDIIA